MGIKGMIYMPTWMDVLGAMENGQTRQELAIKSKVTFYHVFRIAKVLVEKGWARKCKQKGRIVPIKLTKKGKEMQEWIINIKNMISAEAENE